MKRVDRRSRKLQGMLGPLRVVWHDTDDAALEMLLEWKGRQRQATGSPNVFDLPWARQLLAVLRLPRSDDFGGVLTAPYRRTDSAPRTSASARAACCTIGSQPTTRSSVDALPDSSC
jgi:hypothetical protein